MWSARAPTTTREGACSPPDRAIPSLGEDLGRRCPLAAQFCKPLAFGLSPKTSPGAGVLSRHTVTNVYNQQLTEALPVTNAVDVGCFDGFAVKSGRVAAASRR
jgi:hypothetical protein